MVKVEGEVEVLNKYYPPDFDPNDLPRNKRDKLQTSKVRMMLPMSIRCNICGEYLYRGKKFNSIKETVLGEDYLGIKIYRFYMRCTRCSSEFTIKTDPKNCDYVTESNCSRNFEPWRQQNEEIEQLEKEKQEEEGDAMKRLENRTLESKIEMDILDGLDTIKSLNAKHLNVTYEKIFEDRNKKIQQEEEEMLKNVVFQNSGFIRRIKDEDDEEDTKISEKTENNTNNANNNTNNNIITENKKDDIMDIFKKDTSSQSKKKIGELSSPAPQIIVKKKRKVEEEEKKEESLFDLISNKKPPTKKVDTKKNPPPKKESSNALSSLLDY